MNGESLFINGVFEGVLHEILLIQAELPESILYLQPFSGRVMTKLRDDPPSVESPMRLYLSVTTALATVRYEAEVVGWNDKRALSPQTRHALNRVIYCLQPGEGGVYDAARSGDGKSVNLLHIRRLRKLTKPFRVDRLVKSSDSKVVSPNRTTSGGWSYIKLGGSAV